jgi:hypothetical protein
MDYSFQLYSARNEKSLDDTLKTLKSLGYAQVEGWGGQFADPAALAASLKNAGLVMPTAHMGYTQLEDTDAALKIAETVGIETVYCPAPPTPIIARARATGRLAVRPRPHRRRLQGRRQGLWLPQPPLGIRQYRRQDADRDAPRCFAQHAVGT